MGLDDKSMRRAQAEARLKPSLEGRRAAAVLLVHGGTCAQYHHNHGLKSNPNEGSIYLQVLEYPAPYTESTRSTRISLRGVFLIVAVILQGGRHTTWS